MLNDPTRPKWKAGCLKLFCFTNLSPVKAKTHFLFCLLILLSVRILFSSVVPLFILQILDKVLPRTAFMLQWISHTHTREVNSRNCTADWDGRTVWIRQGIHVAVEHVEIILSVTVANTKILKRAGRKELRNKEWGITRKLPDELQYLIQQEHSL